jgi:DNA-dependent RNA polymerase auxiliary subunit epsilon
MKNRYASIHHAMKNFRAVEISCIYRFPQPLFLYSDTETAFRAMRLSLLDFSIVSVLKEEPSREWNINYWSSLVKTPLDYIKENEPFMVLKVDEMILHNKPVKVVAYALVQVLAKEKIGWFIQYPGMQLEMLSNPAI